MVFKDVSMRIGCLSELRGRRSGRFFRDRAVPPPSLPESHARWTTHPLLGKQSDVNGFCDESYPKDCFSRRLYEILFGGPYIGPTIVRIVLTLLLSCRASKRFRNAYDCVLLGLLGY